MQTMSIVVQVQMGGQFDRNLEALEDAGWTKIDIFDSFSRVITGR